MSEEIKVSKDEALEHLYKSLQYFHECGATSIRKGEQLDGLKCLECGSEAHARRSSYNGHLCIWCDKCGILLQA